MKKIKNTILLLIATLPVNFISGCKTSHDELLNTTKNEVVNKNNKTILSLPIQNATLLNNKEKSHVFLKNHSEINIHEQHNESKINKNSAVVNVFTGQKFSDEERVLNDDLEHSQLSEKRSIRLTPLSTKQTTKRHVAPITLEDTLQIALEWHPSIKNSQFMVQAAMETIDGSKADYFPQVSVGFDNKLYENRDRYGKSNTGTDARVTLKQLVYDFGKTSSKVDSAKLSYKKEQIQATQSRQELMYDVAQAYYYTTLYNKLVSIAEDQVNGFSHIEGLARKRAISGAATEADYVQSKNKLVAARSLLNNYKTQQQRWSITLENFTNNRVGLNNVPSIMAPELANLCVQDLDINSTANEIKLAEINYELAKNNKRFAKLDNFPSVYLEGNYRKNINKDDDYGRDSNRRDIMVNLDVPILEGGRKLSYMAQAANELYASQYEYNRALIENEQKVRVSTAQVKGNIMMLSSQQDKIDTAKLTRDLYLLQYKNLGTRPLVDVLNAEGDIHQSMIEYNSNINDINIQSLDCLYNSGNIDELIV